MLWAAGLAVAALAAFVAFQVADNNSTSVAPAQTEVGASVADVIRQSDLAAQAPSISDLIRQAETFQAPAVANAVTAESLAQANPAAASAIGQSAAAAVAVNPAQAGAISGPAVSAAPALAPVAAPSFFEAINQCVPFCGATGAEAEPIADDLGELAQPKAAVNPNLGGATPF